MKYLLKGVLFGVLFFLFFSVKGQNQNDSVSNNLLEKGVELAETMLDLVTWENERHVVSVYPAGGYSPRTGLEVGIMPVWRIKPGNIDLSRPTTVTTSFQVSTTGMYEAKVDLMSYFKNDWMFWSKIQYLFLPDEFYGLGNEMKAKPYSQYDLTSFEFSSDIAKGIRESWYFGFRLDLIKNEQDNIQGDLLGDEIPGYNGGWSNGVGPIVAFDNRNDVLYPSKGWMIMASRMWYGHLLGGDYKFNLTSLDVRKYIEVVRGKSIWACQAVLDVSDGDVPFYKMPGISGKYKLRGIPHPYKYIDQAAWYVQSEWRQQLWWRIGAVAFAGTGKVMSGLNSSWFNQLHVVGGVGLRFRALPDDGLNFRMDYGFSNHNEGGIFFTIREAF